jgi:hypothetical protein
MSHNFKVTGAEALLAIAACERTTSLTGHAETKPGQNITFAPGAVTRKEWRRVSAESRSGVARSTLMPTDYRSS